MSKKNEKKQRRAERWEQCRLASGQRLAAPPAKGELHAEPEKLAAKKRAKVGFSAPVSPPFRGSPEASP